MNSRVFWGGLAFCLAPLVAGQALLAAHVLPAAAAIPGSVVIAFAIGAAARRLVAPPHEAGERTVDRPRATEPLDRHRLVGQLIGGVAHDLNNMLATALGALELMERRADDPERVLVLAKRSIEAIDKAAALASSLVRFARRERLSPRPTDINAVIADLRPLITCALGRRIRLVTELEADLRHGHTDAAALEAALLGICFAARAALADGGQIALTTRRVAEMPAVTVTGLSIVVTIGDTRLEVTDLDLGDARLAAAAAGAALQITRREGSEREALVQEISLVVPLAR